MTTFSKSDSTQSAAQPKKELEISAPSAVVHSGHVGFGANGLNMSGASVPPELRILMARLDQKLTQMGATELTPAERDAVLRKMIAAPRVSAKPGATARLTTASPIHSPTPTTHTTTSSAPPLPPKPETPRTGATAAQRGGVAAAANQENLRMLSALLKERDDKISNLESEIRNLKSAKLESSNSDLNRLAEEKRVLQTQKRELENQLAQERAKNSSVGVRSAQNNSDITKIVEERVAAVTAASRSEIEQLKARIVSLEKERDDLIDARAKLEVEISRATSKLQTQPTATSTGDAAKKDQEIKALKDELYTTKTKLETVENAKFSLQTQVDTLKSQLNSVEGNRKGVDVEVAALTAKLSEITASHSTTLETLRSENTKLSSDVLTAKQQLSDAQLALQASKAQVSNSGSELESFKAALQKEVDSARQLAATEASARAELLKAKDSLTAKLEALQSQLDAEKLKTSREADTASTRADRIAELEKTLKDRGLEHKTEVDALKAEVQKSKDSGSTLEASKRELGALEEQLKTALAEAKQAQARLSTVTGDKERALKEKADLETQVRELATQIATQKSGVSDSKVDVDSLEQEIQKLREEVTKERNAKNMVEDAKETLETSVVSLKSSLASAKDAQKDAENQLRDARKELDVIRAQLNELEESASLDSSAASAPLAPPPPAPAPPPPSSTGSTRTASTASSSSSAAAGGGMDKSLLESIRNPDIALKHTSQMLRLPADVTDGDDILAALAKRIIDRRGRMKGAEGEEEELDLDDLDGEDW